MIVLDTNVVSEAMKPHGSPTVVAWLDLQVAETLYLTATSLSELLLGIAVLPAGRRRHGLDATLNKLVERLFGPRVLPFDEHCARKYAVLAGRARASGRVVSVGDGQIAAVAAVRGFTVATRDTPLFAAAGVPVINPWDVAA